MAETEGRAYRITQPNLQYNRGERQVGLIYDRDGYTFCAFIGESADDLRSWYTRQYTQEEAEREKEACFLFGYVQRMEVLEFTGRTEERRTFAHLSQRTAQEWLKDADGARRCLASGLMLHNGSIIDRTHGPVQLHFID